jgi:quinol monooxygenase YgiN
MTTPSPVTLVNIFTVAPENQQRLAALLKEGTQSWIRRIPGFVSSTLHLSRDGQRIVIYGQWQSADGPAAMRQSPEMPPYFERVKALAQMEAVTCDAGSTVLA